MVLTRRQEQLIAQQNTPPPGGPKTTVLADGRELKSALKTRRLSSFDAEEYAGNKAKTPTRRSGNDNGDLVTPHQDQPPASIGKRVRIHSGNNIVHFFQASSLETDNLYDDDDGEEYSAGRTPVRRRRSRKSGGSVVPIPREIVALIAMSAWMISSSALIFLNKAIMVDKGFPYPLALVAITQIGSGAFGWLSAPLGMATVRPFPPLRIVILGLLPVAMSSAGCLFFGNFSYLGLSVAFINILKALTPVATLLIGLLMGIEHPSVPTLLATLLMAWGTGLATSQETANSAHFSWLAFSSFLLSIVLEGLRVVLTERLLGAAQYSPMEMTAHVSPLTFVLLAAGSWGFERKGLMAWANSDTVHPSLNDFVLVAAMSFLVNLSTFYGIRNSSATSFKVVGCVKNVFVVLLSLYMGDHLTPKQWQGFAISTFGFLCYTWARSRPSPQYYKRKST